MITWPIMGPEQAEETAALECVEGDAEAPVEWIDPTCPRESCERFRLVHGG